MERIDLDLSTISNGELNMEFKDLIKMILGRLESGQKANIDIKIELARSGDNNLKVIIAHKISHKMPPAEGLGLAYVQGDNSLKIDKAHQANKANVVNMFE